METEYFDEENAVAELIKDGVLWTGEAKDPNTICLYVLCNDIFAWATGDGEDIPLSELENLYNMVKKDSKWGSTKWCCIQRNEKPQNSIAEGMKKDNVWDEVMEKLPENHYDKYCKEKFGGKLLWE